MNAHNAAQYLPLVQAMADGKKLEINLGNNEWISTGEITFSNAPSNYRIVPESTRVITPGRWRMRNGNIVAVIKCGEVISSSDDTKTWYRDGSYQLIEDHPFDLISKIETKCRPWKPEEIVVGTVVKTKDLGTRLLIVKVTFNERIILGGDTTGMSVEDLHRDFTQLDGTPCGVEEEEVG